MTGWGEGRLQLFDLQTEFIWVFQATPFLLEIMTHRPSRAIQIWDFSDIFSKRDQMSLSLSGKLTVLISNDEIQAFKQKLDFFFKRKRDYSQHRQFSKGALGLIFVILRLDSFLTLKDLSDEIGGDSTKCDF